MGNHIFVLKHEVAQSGGNVLRATLLLVDSIHDAPISIGFIDMTALVGVPFGRSIN